MTKFRVSATLYKTGLISSIDGPWKSSPEEAVLAFKAKIVKQGLEEKGLFKPFIAERMPRETAPEADSRYGYVTRHDLDAVSQLRFWGLRAYK